MFDYVLAAKPKPDNRLSAWVIMVYRDPEGVLWTLLLKRSKTANNPGLWNYCGGGVEGKEDPMAAALREAMEEAGLRKLKVSGKYGMRTMAGRRYRYYSVMVTRKPKVKIDHESDAYKWVEVSKLDRLSSKLHKATAASLKHSRIRALFDLPSEG